MAGRRRRWRSSGRLFLFLVGLAEQRGDESLRAPGYARPFRIFGLDRVRSGRAARRERDLAGAGAALLERGERDVVAGHRLAVGRQMHGLAVGEDAGELVAGHARPMADAAGVHVHEGRAGGRIEADAAALHAQPGDAQIRKLDAGDVEIDGLAHHVLAETGDAAAALAQHRVGLRRAIGGDDGDRLLGVDLAVDLPQQIEQLRVHARGFVAPPVAQEPVDLFERLGSRSGLRA